MRLGCLPYLNVKPLIYTFEQGNLPDGWELYYAAPSRLARMLNSNEIAVAPVSSFAWLSNDELEICPNICISTYGPVHSVLLISNVDFDKIESVIIDTSSLSGANMVKIILKEVYGVSPNYIVAPLDCIDSILEQTDAVFVIGDAAMKFDKSDYLVMDIADEWVKLTGLPAVFAVWAGKSIDKELENILKQARNEGVLMLETISKNESARLRMDYDFCLDYLRNINYSLGEKEALGLKAFRDLAIDHKLLQKHKARKDI
ncbi:MAG: menaquinone biosynthesis protein [Armatimonadota bacterium]